VRSETGIEIIAKRNFGNHGFCRGVLKLI